MREADMRVEGLVWVVSRIAIVGVSAWTLVACSSKGYGGTPSTTNPTPDAGPLPCTVTSAAPPSCKIVLEAVSVDAGDAGDVDAGDDASTPDDAGAPDAAVYDGDGSCPIVTASQITCSGDNQLAAADVSLAAGTNGDAYASLVTQIGTTYDYGSQLAELHGDGTGTIDLEPVPKANRVRALPVVTGDGSLALVAERSTLDLEYYTRANSAWNPEKIPGSPYDDNSLLGAASSSGGNVFALLMTDYAHVTVASRAASGGWTSGASFTTASSASSALAVDTDGTPYVLVSSDSATYALMAGDGQPTTFPAPDSYGGALTLAVAGAHGGTKQPIALRMDDAGSLLDVVALGNQAGTRVFGGERSTTCSGFTIGIDCSSCKVGSTCDTYADQIQAYATAMTDDGTVWLATIDESVDLHGVVDVENDPLLLGCYCTTKTQSTSLVSTTLVLTPLGPHGEASGVTLRIPFDPSVGAAKVAMAANGSALHMLVTGSATISHAAIDTARIPRRGL